MCQQKLFNYRIDYLKKINQHNIFRITLKYEYKYKINS